MFLSRILNFSARKKILSLDEALYLTKEVGITTKTELQHLTVISPPFSPDKSPFLINNPFRTGNVQDEKVVEEDVEDNWTVGDIIKADQGEISKIDRIVPGNVDPKSLKLFWYGGNWWKVDAEGFGTCMRSTSHVIIRRGSGIVKVNKEEDIYKRWPLFYNRMDVLEPFYLGGCAGVYDLFIQTNGGGTTGQSRATRLAVARALVDANPILHYNLKDALYEDLRQRMPKMPGRTGARAQRKWVKR